MIIIAHKRYVLQVWEMINSQVKLEKIVTSPEYGRVMETDLEVFVTFSSTAVRAYGPVAAMALRSGKNPA